MKIISKNILYYTFTLGLIISSCHSSTTNNDEKESHKNNNTVYYRENVKLQVKITNIDDYTRELNNTTGIRISERMILTSQSAIKGSYSNRLSFFGQKVEPMAKGYTFNNPFLNIVLLEISGKSFPTIEYSEAESNSEFYAINILERNLKIIPIKISGSYDFRGFNLWESNDISSANIAIFDRQHKFAGVSCKLMAEGDSKIAILPSKSILEILKSTAPPKNVYSLTRSRAIDYPTPESVKKFLAETSYGDFEFKIYDDLKDYKRNTIKLSLDGYYDSLLIHRVIHNFLIQTGAADTKYAKQGDPVGWLGPGYLLPTIINSKYFHKRGAIAASKPPSYKNPKNLTDGGQFYIICGRKFTETELTEIEKQKGQKFTSQQRKIYTTEGGAPYLDFDYAVIGEVTKGMNVIDSIAALAVQPDERPVNDVRLFRIKPIIN